VLTRASRWGTLALQSGYGRDLLVAPGLRFFAVRANRSGEGRGMRYVDLPEAAGAATLHQSRACSPVALPQLPAQLVDPELPLPPPNAEAAEPFGASAPEIADGAPSAPPFWCAYAAGAAAPDALAAAISSRVAGGAAAALSTGGGGSSSGHRQATASSVAIGSAGRRSAVPLQVTHPLPTLLLPLPLLLPTPTPPPLPPPPHTQRAASLPAVSGQLTPPCSPSPSKLPSPPS
jgi:hypothetical protein